MSCATSSISPQHVNIDGFARSGNDSSGMGMQDEKVVETSGSGSSGSSDGMQQSVSTEGGKTTAAPEEREVEVLPPKVYPDPGQPNATERALHEMLHMPYRSWCEDCVQGQGKDRYHLRLEEDGVLRIAMDYMFLTERE